MPAHVPDDQPVAPGQGSKKRATQKKGAPKAKKSAKPTKAAKAPRAGAKKGATDARSNKKREVIAMKSSKNAAGESIARIAPPRTRVASTRERRISSS